MPRSTGSSRAKAEPGPPARPPYDERALGSLAPYGEAVLTYDDYLNVPELLRLQVPLSKPPHHDELLFIIIHQAYELWFKLLLHEIDSAIEAMRRGDAWRADHYVRRIVQVLQLLVRQIHLLETMTPIEFLEFRDHLKPASGFQSVQFREIEFRAGLKDPAYLHFFNRQPRAVASLRRRLREPDLRSAYFDLLRKLGHRLPPQLARGEDDGDARGREALRRALLPLYEDPQARPALYQLTESLLSFDEWFSLWRHHHVLVVERIIGAKTGTGGSSGASYLRTTTSKRAFSFLWDVRTHLGEAP